MSGLPSDEVVDDYKNSLEDLVTNDRISIGNLTVIAKECIEHAQAISRVLENHIIRAPPARKLPAFYVLDSIAKNVGSPYTVYFGLNLFHTYMNTFASVDNNVRRKLDEMRKTWSQPVPGSQATYPVFQKTVTSKIDEAMDSWARRNFQNRPQVPTRGPVAPFPGQPYSVTPTPPPPPPPPGQHSFQQQNYPNQQPYPNINGGGLLGSHPLVYSQDVNQNVQHLPSRYSQPPAPVSTPPTYLSTQQHMPLQSFQYPPQLLSTPTPGPPLVDMEKLKEDIEDLTLDAKINSLSNPMDRSMQQKLESLQSLKEIVDTGTLSGGDLADVRKSISEQLAARSSQRPRLVVPQPTTQPAISYPYQQPSVQEPPPTTNTPSFLNPTNLAELLRATAPPSQPTPPPIHSTPILPPTSMHQNGPAYIAQTPAENPLIAQLRASGLLAATPSPPSRGPPISLPMNTPSLTAGSSSSSISISIKFSSSSFKTPRPDLLKYLFEARPNRCTTCGRRFASDDAGREKKARHLDWHFKTKTRMVEAERRGVQRSWYVDEREWIRSREYEDDEGPAGEIGDGSALSTSAAGVTKKKEAVLRVPNDAKLRSEPCPICQEKFENMWSEELQDFIWKDAKKVGNRVYHASCYEQATKDRENVSTPVVAGERARTATPDSVLGKRKALAPDFDGSGERKVTKIKSEQMA